MVLADPASPRAVKEGLKQAEAALRQSEASFRELAEATPQPVWVAGPDGTVHYYNSRLTQYLGFQQAPDGNWIWQPVLHPDDAAPTLAAWQAAVAEGKPYEFEHRVRMADGSFHWHLSRAQPARDAEGNIVKWFGTATDIHHQKQAQELLEITVQERTTKLRESIAELEHFSYTITHDMRAPLRAMQAFGEIIREEYDERLDEVGRDYLQRIVAAANRMDNLITDALNYSKAVQTELMLEPIPPGSLLREILDSYPQFHHRRDQIDVIGTFPSCSATKPG
jgi:PAS domain S-box-containing protein